MKTSITKKLILINTCIVLFAMLVFYAITVVYWDSKYAVELKDQLVLENNFALQRYSYNFERIEESVQMESSQEVNPNKEHIFSFMPDQKSPSKFSRSINMVIYVDENGNNSVYNLLRDENYQFNSTLTQSEVDVLFDVEVDKTTAVNISGQSYYATKAILPIDQSIFLNLGENMYGDIDMTKDLSVISILPTEEVDSFLKENTMLFLLSLVLILVFSTIVIILSSRRITKPILELTEVTKQYAERKFDGKMDVRTGDEIEVLANSVDNMARSLIDFEKKQTGIFRKISHELKTPLTSISGYAEGIEKGLFKDNAEALSIIKEESMRIKKMVEDLILISKIESNVEQFDIAPHEVNELVIDCIKKIEALAILSDIEIVFNPIKSCNILCDREKMIRAITNILYNSLKYTNDLIELSIQIEGNTAKIIVRDNGEGISQSTMDTLFLDISKEKTNGNGIGLLVVKEILQKHGGDVLIENLDEGLQATLYNIKISQ